MSTENIGVARLDREALRRSVAAKYSEVATNPELGFHFHTGRPLAMRLAYTAAAVDGLPPANLESFAGTGNPFLFGDLRVGEWVVDVGCGAGLDTLIAARQVGTAGRVIAVDMTAEMRAKTVRGATEMGLTNVEVREGFAESLPVDDGWADVVISNGVVNLCPDKHAVFREMFRILKPGGRIQIGDILVHKEVPQSAKDDIALWSG
ncbi:MAG TPA: methyltransferase domain-containing protein [Candidatus Limnocylindria bacterium]|jgi:SAM-dependent methyltransferase